MHLCIMLVDVSLNNMIANHFGTMDQKTLEPSNHGHPASPRARQDIIGGQPI